MSEIVARGEVVQIDDLKARFGEFQCGPYPEGVNTALARALVASGSNTPQGVIILGVSPRLPLNETYRNHLEQVTVAASVALRNALAYEQERKRAEALAAIDRAKTQFFANISHEFRTPLALMLGPLENVLSSAVDELSEDNREQICIAKRNSLRLLRLMNALLDFSRIEAGRAQATFELTDLSSLTAELAATFRSMIESAGMELIVHCSALGEDIYVDREMWEKIVLNLLSNAYKFTMHGKIQVDLTLAGDTVQLTVADTGSGIPKQQLLMCLSDSIASKARRGARTKEAGLAWH